MFWYFSSIVDLSLTCLMNSPNSTFIKKWALRHHSHEERFVRTPQLFSDSSDNPSVPVLCTWLVTVSANGAPVTVEPLATGVSTRLVCPRSWQGRGCRTEAPGCVALEVVVVADRSVDDRELSWGATTVKVWEEIVPLNIFFLASSTCHRRKMLFILILYIYFFPSIYYSK